MRKRKKRSLLTCKTSLPRHLNYYTLFCLMCRLDAQTLLVLSNHVLSLSIIVMLANDRPSMLTSGSELDRAMPTVSVSSSILSSVVVTCMQTDWLDSYVRL